MCREARTAPVRASSSSDVSVTRFLMFRDHYSGWTPLPPRRFPGAGPIAPRLARAATERLIEVNRYGERLTGCIECNLRSSDKRAFVIELSVKDFEALRMQRQGSLRWWG
jgi:hypothetical protein